jgi:hypothetical protein
MDSMDNQDGGMDWDAFAGEADSNTGGTLHLHDGRHIAVQRINHVGALFLFYSRANDQRGHAISRDDVRAWESMRPRP